MGICSVSSGEFYCDLIPHRRLRRLPLLSGCAALLIGAVLIVRMPLPGLLRYPFCLAWLAFCVYEIQTYSRTAAALRVLRIRADGTVDGRLQDGRWQRLQMLPGSIVLSRIAWLRLRLPDGRNYGELLRHSAGDGRQWHRLQLIWRQNRAAFGHPERS